MRSARPPPELLRPQRRDARDVRRGHAGAAHRRQAAAALADRIADAGAGRRARRCSRTTRSTNPSGPRPSAATETMPSATAGGLTAISKSGFSFALALVAGGGDEQRRLAERLLGLHQRGQPLEQQHVGAIALERASRSPAPPGSPCCSISCSTKPGKSMPSDIEMTFAPLVDRPLDRADDLVARRRRSRRAPCRSAPSSRRGATPIRVPSTSRPKIVPAQCVPWPCASSSPSPVKFFSHELTPANAGCVASMPVSSTATTMPSPVNGEVSRADRLDAPGRACDNRRPAGGGLHRRDQLHRHHRRDRHHVGALGQRRDLVGLDLGHVHGRDGDELQGRRSAPRGPPKDVASPPDGAAQDHVPLSHVLSPFSRTAPACSMCRACRSTLPYLSQRRSPTFRTPP